MKDRLSEIISAIASGVDKEALQRDAHKAVSEIDSEIRGLQQQMSLIQGLAIHYKTSGESHSVGVPQSPRPPAPLSDAATGPQRHRIIYDAALAVSRNTDTIQVSQVTEELERRGYRFSRSNQRVGTVLQYHREDFRPIGDGYWEVLWWRQGEATTEGQTASPSNEL